MIIVLRTNLEKAQQRMRSAADKHRRDVEYVIGDMVLLKLQQYRQYSVARPLSTKLARRFYGPFKVIERIGMVAYRLQLPEGSRVHNVFHVSLLRPFVDGSKFQTTELPSRFARGRPVSRPMRLLDVRTIWNAGAAVEEGLLQWEDDGGERPSWEPMTVIRRRFSHLLEDKELPMGEGVDTSTTRPRRSETIQEIEEVPTSFDAPPDCDTVERGRKGHQVATTKAASSTPSQVRGVCPSLNRISSYFSIILF